MAKGDVVIQITDIATGADLDFQPSAGVEVLIAHIGSEAHDVTVDAPNVDVMFFDGSIESLVFDSSVDIVHNIITQPMKLLINNGHYLRITNNSGSNANLSYSGIQTK